MRTARSLLQVLEASNALLDRIDTAAVPFSVLIEGVQGAFQKNDANTTHLHFITPRAKAQEGANSLRTPSVGSFFVALNELIKHLNSLELDPDHRKYFELDELLAALLALLAAAEEFVNASSDMTAARVVIAAKEAQTAELTTDRIARAVTLSSDEDTLLADDEGIVDLYLEGSTTADDFARKLVALLELYDGTARLLGISLERYPPRLIRFQSGTIWATLAGNAVVVNFIVTSIITCAGLVYAKVSKDGRVQRVKKDAEAITAVQTAIREVGADGNDVTEANADQARSVKAVAKQLRIVLEGQSEVRVNDRVLSPVKAAMKRLPGLPKGLLNAGTPSQPSDGSETGE